MLEKNLQMMMECVDDLAQDTNKFINYQRQAAKQDLNKKQYLLKRVSKYFSWFALVPKISFRMMARKKIFSFLIQEIWFAETIYKDR